MVHHFFYFFFFFFPPIIVGIIGPTAFPEKLTLRTLLCTLLSRSSLRSLPAYPVLRVIFSVLCKILLLLLFPFRPGLFTFSPYCLVLLLISTIINYVYFSITSSLGFLSLPWIYPSRSAGRFLHPWQSVAWKLPKATLEDWQELSLNTALHLDTGGLRCFHRSTKAGKTSTVTKAKRFPVNIMDEILVSQLRQGMTTQRATQVSLPQKPSKIPTWMVEISWFWTARRQHLVLATPWALMWLFLPAAQKGSPCPEELSEPHRFSSGAWPSEPGHGKGSGFPINWTSRNPELSKLSETISFQLWQDSVWTQHYKMSCQFWVWEQTPKQVNPSLTGASQQGKCFTELEQRWNQLNDGKS